MPTTTQKQPAARTPAQAKTLLDEILDQTVSYVPFAAKDPIKLSANLVLRYLCTPTKSGKVCDERQATRFVMLCKARGLNPWEGDAFIVGYDTKDGPQFSLVTAHQAFLKRAEVHPEYDGMDSGVVVRRLITDEDGERRFTVDIEGDYFDEDDQLVGGWARVFFKTRGHPTYRRLKLASFSTGWGRWEKDPGGMIVKCAEADAFRSSFPNSLGGMYLEADLAVAQYDERRPAEPPTSGRQNLRARRTLRDNGEPGAKTVMTIPDGVAPSHEVGSLPEPGPSMPAVAQTSPELSREIGDEPPED